MWHVLYVLVTRILQHCTLIIANLQEGRKGRIERSRKLSTSAPRFPRQFSSRCMLEKIQTIFFVRTYALIDDQRNCFLAKSELFDLLGIKTETKNLKLETCSGVRNMITRVAKNILFTSLDDSTTHQLPPVIVYDAVPDNRYDDL